MGSQYLLEKALGLLLLGVLCAGQGLPVQYGLLPTGDLTTTDQDGPYFIPAVQAVEVEGTRGNRYSVRNSYQWHSACSSIVAALNEHGRTGMRA